MLKLLVVLAAVALVARRLLPHRRMSWAVPVVVGVTIVVVRSAAYLLGQD